MSASNPKKLFVAGVVALTLMLSAAVPAEARRTPDVSEGPVQVVGDGALGTSVTCNTNPSDWTADVTFSYSWYRTDGWTAPVIPGATSSTYTISSDDIGYGAVYCQITGSKSGYNSSFSYSDQFFLNPMDPAPVPELTSPVQIGTEVDANNVQWADGASLAYQWNLNGFAISGATDPFYTPVDSDAGGSLTLSITGSQYGFRSVTVTSAASTVTGRAKLNFTGYAPVISGAGQVGTNLSASTPGWDNDVTFTYQWLRDGSEILSATSSTYLLIRYDYGHNIAVQVTGSKDSSYNPVVETSETVSPTLGTQRRIGTPRLWGDSTVDSTLHVDEGYWDNNTTFTYQWLRDGAPISDANANTYPVVRADAGHSISLLLTSSKTGYNDASAVSAQTYIPNLPAVISGTLRVGETLTIDPGTQTNATSFSFVWYANRREISGETGLSLVLGPAQSRTRIGVKITAYEGPVVLGSSFKYLDKLVMPATMSVIGAPTISTTGYAGDLISVDPGTWAEGVSLTYAWYKNGTLLGAIDGPVYAIDASDARAVFKVKVTASALGYRTVSLFSNTVKVIGLHTIALASTPIVSGTAKSGSTLSVVDPAWGSDISYSYVWFRNGTAIDGATLSSYTLTTDDVRSRITVAVSGSKANYRTATWRSVASAKVTKG